jgi:hypothetical protein
MQMKLQEMVAIEPSVVIPMDFAIDMNLDTGVSSTLFFAHSFTCGLHG